MSAEFSYLQIKGPISASGNPSTRVVTAVCPFGKFVVGGGFEIDSAPSGNHEPPFATKSAPASSTTWTVTVERGSITRDSWSARAYAICVGD
ncbi:MAG: hypothetical protein WA964_18410 [Ilumatobacter sp.]|uniref:hypothetical protein n=1 Tax=Ilumatobacter sp. TaxID=1967498 RepID=UPI003C7655BF